MEQAEIKPQPQGFDLSGDEFALKADSHEPVTQNPP